MDCPKVGVLHALLAMHCPLLPMRWPFFAMRRPICPIHPPFVAMRRPFAAVLHAFVAVLHAFAATRSEGKDGGHEESVGHPARHSVLCPVLTTPRQNRGRAVLSRPRRSEWVGSGSERATTRPARVGMRREKLETSHEERTMPTVKRRSRRPHPPSLQRFVLEELAPFTKEGTFSTDASQDFHLFYVGRDD